MVALYHSGLSIRDVGKKVGISHNSVYNVVKRLSRTRDVGRDPQEVRIIVDGCYRRYPSQRQAAAALGISRQLLHQRIANNQISTWREDKFREHPGIDCMPDALLLWKLKRGLVEYTATLLTVRHNIERAVKSRIV